jgi:hypothetical protein
MRSVLALLICSILIHHGRSAEPVDYARDIKPALKERCYACHGALKQEAELRVDTVASLMKAEVVSPGKPKDSELLSRVSARDAKRMPPEGKPLTPDEIAKFRTWIEQGAKAPADERPEEDPKQHWAFLKPVRPKVSDTSANPIDALLEVERSARNIKSAGEADKATLLRRVYLDLIGLPPTREQLHAFLKDTSPTAYEKVVDQLLASPQYGERWARHWMDVWRYSDWYGRRGVPDVLNSYGQIWRWRDWIVRAANEDRGYDRMVRDMLAADELTPTDDANVVATGFVVRNFYRWNYNNWMRDQVEHTAKAFLGLTMNCCHCHDHKYDPITQEEYFRLRAVFEPIEIRQDRVPGEADPGVYPKYSYGASYKPITTGMVRVVEEKLDAKTHFYTGGDERNVAKNRDPIPPGVPESLGGTFEATAVQLPPEAWYPGLKAFVRKEETELRTKAIATAEAGRDVARRELTTAVGKDVLPTPDELEPTLHAVRVADLTLAAAKADLAALQARIAADDVAYLGKPGDKKATAEAANRAESVHRVAAAQLAVAKAEQAVATARRKKETAAQVPNLEKQVTAAKAALVQTETAAKVVTDKYTPLSHQYPKATTGRRSALAKWIANRDNPLTARVAVNHLWGWHFGRPLVETTNNFGRSGKKPTHPQLLDWLAVEFMDNGWKAKPLHRLILTSKAYKMSSKSDAAQHAADPDNVYLARFPSARVEAEVVRDSLLHVAGELDLKMGGVEIPQDQGMTVKRRSLYFAHHGESRMTFLDLFDAANPCDAYRRSAAVLPQQALAMSNSNLALQLGRSLAAKLPAADDRAFVVAAFEQVLSRPPTDAEVSASLAFLARQVKLFETSKADGKPTARAKENLVQALFNHTDFVTVR